MSAINVMNSLPQSYRSNGVKENRIPEQIISEESVCFDNNHNDLLSHIDPDHNFNTKYVTNDCKYYTITEFKNTFKVADKLSLFHSNIRSAHAHIKENFLNFS